MKLISKTIIIFFLISLPVLVLATWFSYSVLKTEIAKDELEAISKDRQYLKQLIDQNSFDTNSPLSADGLSKIEIIPNKNHQLNYVKDTLIFDNEEQEYVTYKLYVTAYQNNKHTFKVTLAKNQKISTEFIENLMFTISWVLLLLVVVFLLVNWYLSRVVWRPFFKTLKQLNEYSISGHQAQLFESTTTYEFNQLNKALTEMTDAIYKTYQEQKEFTENASHEMQTPLAVVRANMEMLMQSSHLSENDMLHIERIERSIQKLSSLNKTLLLLAKIENKQYKDTQKLRITPILLETIGQFEDLIKSQNITIEIDKLNEIEIAMDPVLAEILFNNLILNAIRHNLVGGKIIVTSSKNELRISNSGNKLSFNAAELFDRFKKSHESTDSTGLGLSIVKGILNSYGYSIEYSFDNHFHLFILTFS
jgi:signal transduction histidine kinase